MMKSVPRKKLAIANIVKGLIAQLMNRVSATGLTALPARTTSWKSIFTMIGYIMKKRHSAIGIDTTGAPSTVMAMATSDSATPGASLPRAMPTTIQRATQTER